MKKQLICKPTKHNYIPTKVGNWNVGYKIIQTCKKCGKIKRSERLF